MNVLVVSTNRCRDPVPVIPLGACLAARAAEASGYRVRLLDLMFQRDPREALIRELRTHPPAVVGLSIRNLDNTTMEAPESFLPQLEPLLEALRAHSSAAVALGGAAVGVAPEGLLEHTGADWAVAGEGERAFPALLRAIDAGKAPASGVIRPEAGGLPAEGWPFADPGRWLDPRPYLARGAAIPVQTKRGCPLQCVYCPCPRVEGSRYRLCPPEQAGEELERLQRAGYRDVELVDTVFNAPRDHALAFCEEVARRGLRLRLHSYELNPGFIDDPLLGAMEQACFLGAGVTAESASPAVLAGLGKNYGAEELRRAAETLRRHRIPCLWLFMLGGPNETEKTAAETLRFAATALGPADVAFFTLGIRIFPGTELERIAREEGVWTGTSEELLRPAFYVSPRVEARRLSDLLCRAVADHPNFLRFGMSSLRFLPAVRRIGAKLLSPPLWKHTPRLRRLLSAVGIRERASGVPPAGDV